MPDRRTNRGNGSLRCLLTGLDAVGRAKELEQPDVAELWRDHDVGWIADEARARNSILDQRERAREHREHTRLVPTALEEVADKPDPLEFRVRWVGVFIVDIVERVVFERSLAEGIGVEVDRDGNMGAEGATDRNGDGIDQSTVDEPVAIVTHGWEKTGDRIRGPNGIDQGTTADPDFLTGREVGSHRD